MRSSLGKATRSSKSADDGGSSSRGDESGPSATVLNIQRTSTEDGPGLRTTVFLKGCSLACTWCHNPEAIDPKPQLVWYQSRCIGSRECIAICLDNALTCRGDGIEIDHARCNACGDCAERCPSGALETLGTRWQVDDLVAEVVKDRSYFEAYGGGVTVSGGEPGLHAPFVAPFLQRCRALGVHTAIDTCGMCSASSLRVLTDHSDLVLYDIKEIDPDRHARLTGQSNERILANLIDLAARMRAGSLPSELWIRTPLIPEATAREANLEGIGRFIARHVGDVVTRWELCAFNNLAADKYARLGLQWRHAETPLLTARELREIEQTAKRSGVDPEIILATGPTRMEPTLAGAAEVETSHDGTH
jgi:pyruvate formate lyase activating enzyme